MNVTTPSARLQRLSQYLQEDPDNPDLLAETCEAALACGQHQQVEALLVSAERLLPGAPDWKQRRAQLCIAQGELARARTLLEELWRVHGEHPALTHDFAYVQLASGDAQAACSLLQPWMERSGANDDLHLDPLRCLWLRACHQLGQLEDAWEWTQRAQAAQALRPAVAGVASLVALDCDQLDAARVLADTALSADARHPQALIARASLALAAGSPGEAASLFQRTLEVLPQDGRAWAGLGFARLLAGNAAAAVEALERALQSNPRNADAWQALGWARMLLQDTAAAVTAFRCALEHDDMQAPVHASLALALGTCGDVAAAQAHLRRAQELDAGADVVALARAVLAGGAQRDELATLVQRLLAQWTARP